jgi:Tfp pilus assembly protein PilN
MNAVNLIPADRRTRRMALPTSPPTLALLGVLALALIGAVLYVSTANQVSARRSQLARVTAGAAAWNAAAARYGASVQAFQHHAKELADVQQLADARYGWSQVLSQVSALMPAKAALSSMTASTTPGTTPSAPPTPSIQMTGCAATQSEVAQAMVQLHRITGVTDVALASSSDSAAGSPAGATSGSGQGACGFPVQFQVSLTFRPAAAAATTGSTTSATPPPATPATSAPTASAAAPSTTPSAQ